MLKILLPIFFLATGLHAETLWKANYEAKGCSFVSSGKHPYFDLIPGTVLEYASDDAEVLVVTVLEAVKMVDGVETRVVEEKESKNGKLVEISRNYLALCKESGDLCYFGEDVDMYKDGAVTSHDGSWLSGEKGARYGVLLPGKPQPGQKYYQEQAKGIAMDRAEVISLKEKIMTPAGIFRNCLKTLETTPLETGQGTKIYAPGLGLVKDSDLVLKRRSFPKP